MLEQQVLAPGAPEQPEPGFASIPGGASDSPSRSFRNERDRAALALPPKPKNARYQSLDFWRGAACMMLVLYHGTFYADRQWRTSDPQTWSLEALAMNVVTRLWIGVPLFFVVSGYCIAASIDSLRRRPYSLGNYFTRRFRRIYPPLWAGFIVAIAFCLLIGCWPELYARCEQLPDLAGFTLRAWIGNFTATESWLPTVVSGETSYLLPNTWTLCYEEQFYLVAGALLLVSARRFFAAVAVLTGVVLAGRHLLGACGISCAGFFFDGHWLMFAMGLLVYQRINYYGKQGRCWTAVLLVAGVLYGLSLRLLCATHAERHLGEYIAVAAAFAILLVFLKRYDTRIAGHSLARPLVWCGKISYSIYLTHFPVVVLTSCALAACGVTGDGSVLLLTLPVCVAISLPAGWLFYLLVERHFVNPPTRAEPAA